MQHSGFLSSNSRYWESPLFGCLPLLIKYICSYPTHLEAVRSICSLMKCVPSCQGLIIIDGFQKLYWKSVGNLETVLDSLMLHVRWSLMWNVPQHQLGEPLAPDYEGFFWTACIFFVPWRLQVCPRVSFYSPCYVRHICGLQCYDHLGRICGVQFKKRQ